MFTPIIPRDPANPSPPNLDNTPNALGLIPSLKIFATLGLTPLAAILVAGDANVAPR